MVSSSRPPPPPSSDLQLLQELQSLALSLPPPRPLPPFKKKAAHGSVHPRPPSPKLHAKLHAFTRSVLPLHLSAPDKLPPLSKKCPQDGVHLREQLEVSQRQRREKKRFWKWKPFRAIAHMGQQRFHVLFSLHVHSIERLPAAMNGLRLSVQWGRKEGGLQTMPSRVLQGRAEFNDTLRQRCTIYCSKTTNHGIKYEPKLFTLLIAALDAPGMELGKYHLDLSRLMPQYPGGMEDDDRLSSWTTDFELTGKAKGSSLVVTFKYDVVVHLDTPEQSDALLKRSGSKRSDLFFNRLPNSAHGPPCTTPSNPLVSPSRSEPTVDCDDHLTVSIDEKVRVESDPSAVENSSTQSRGESDPSEMEDGSSQSRVESDQSLVDDGASQSLVGIDPIAVEDSSSPSSHGGLATQFEFRPALKYISREDEQLYFTFPAMQSVESQVGYVNQDAGYASRCEDETNLLVWGMGAEEGCPGCATGGDEKCRLLQSEGGQYDERKSERIGMWENWRTLQEPENAMQHRREPDSLHFAIPSAVFRDHLDGEASTSGHNLVENRDPEREKCCITDAEADLDEEVALVASEFLSMLDVGYLSSDNEPDSPRARLLKQFEHEALLEGGIGATFNTAGASEDSTVKEKILQESATTSKKEERDQNWGVEDALELALVMEAVELDLQKATQIIHRKSRGKILEDDETETLLQQWGLS